MLSTASKQMLILVILATVGIVTLICYPPTSHQYIPCIFNVATGLHCAGCGTTRAIASLLQGNILEASRNNLLLFLWGPYCIYMLFIKILCEYFNKSYTVWQPGKKTVYILISIIIIYTVLRNLPIEQIKSILSPI
ncbi:MAG: hypothetical protein RL348_1285 [Bacteroidota bacterium]